MNTVVDQLWRLRKQFIVTGIGITGWLTFKHLPYSKFINDTGFLLVGTESRARHEVNRLRSIGFKLPKDEDVLYKLSHRIPISIIKQTVEDIDKTRDTPIDISRVNFASTMGVHIGSEYHSGSFKNGAFIVLPGTFGLTQDHKSIYMSAKYFDSSSMMFSLLDSNTWKFMIAKELLYLEEERNMMKFRMYLGSFFLCAGYVAVYHIYKRLWTKENKDKFVFNLVKRKKFSEKSEIQKIVNNTMRSSLIMSIAGMYLVSYVLYKICLYQYCCSKTRKIDKKLATLGTDYVKGGKNYLTKMQESGYYQHHMLSNKSFNQVGNKETNRFLYLFKKTLTREERMNFFTQLGDD